MIKTRKWILCAVFVTALSACGQESSAPAETEKTPEVIEASPQIEDSSQNAGVKELDEAGMRKGIEAYASVMAETFGAEIDFGKPYASDEIANYYRVTNFSTVEEVREYITTLVDAKLIDEETSFRYDFEMKDGVLAGCNVDLYRTLSQACGLNIVASGGVSSLDDVRALADMGLYAAIIGKAYYEGRIDLAEAIRVARGTQGDGGFVSC